MKAYITKYALTQGILEVDGEISGSCPTMFNYLDATSSWNYIISTHKPDWYLSLEEAQAYAEKLRLKKIASINKQMAQLKNMEIKVTVIPCRKKAADTSVEE